MYAIFVEFRLDEAQIPEIWEMEEEKERKRQLNHTYSEFHP
jgi:hypothetical protein